MTDDPFDPFFAFSARLPLCVLPAIAAFLPVPDEADPDTLWLLALLPVVASELQDLPPVLLDVIASFLPLTVLDHLEDALPRLKRPYKHENRTEFFLPKPLPPFEETVWLGRIQTLLPEFEADADGGSSSAVSAEPVSYGAAWYGLDLLAVKYGYAIDGRQMRAFFRKLIDKHIGASSHHVCRTGLLNLLTKRPLENDQGDLLNRHLREWFAIFDRALDLKDDDLAQSGCDRLVPEILHAMLRYGGGVDGFGPDAAKQIRDYARTKDHVPKIAASAEYAALRPTLDARRCG